MGTCADHNLESFPIFLIEVVALALIEWATGECCNNQLEGMVECCFLGCVIKDNLVESVESLLLLFGYVSGVVSSKLTDPVIRAFSSTLEMCCSGNASSLIIDAMLDQ